MSPTPSFPGVYVEEVPSGPRTIAGVETSICVFIGRTPRGPPSGEELSVLHSAVELQSAYGEAHPDLPLMGAVQDFFRNGGSQAIVVRVRAHGGGPEAAQDTQADDAGPALSESDYLGDATLGTGLHALRKLDLFNLLCIPPDAPQSDTSPAVYQAALAVCVERRAMLLVDPPAAWSQADAIAHDNGAAVAALGLTGEAARNAILYFPRVLRLTAHFPQPTACVPCGAVAGVIARIDHQRGVWKAPAGSEAHLRDVSDLAVPLTDLENGLLNPIGVNALRVFPGRGKLVWGARTLRGADSMGDDYKYVPVRRLALYIEESVSRGIAWAALEPNDERLWATLRLNVGAFLQNLFRQGAFQGTTPRDAYFVHCDAQTTSQDDINRGVCNVVIGFAPLKAAEFVVLRIAQVVSTES